MGTTLAKKHKLELSTNGDWKEFPKTAPKDGRPFLVGGFTKGERQWVDVVIRWAPFCGGWQDLCKEHKDLECKWIVIGFMTLDNISDVKFTHWHPLPSAPFIPIQ